MAGGSGPKNRKVNAMNHVRVEQMKSPRSGRPVANQFIIETESGRYFQSYRSVIAFIPYDTMSPVLLDAEYWDYSRTTSRYLYQFLGADSRGTIMAMLRSGRYQLADLNSADRASGYKRLKQLVESEN